MGPSGLGCSDNYSRTTSASLPTHKAALSQLLPLSPISRIPEELLSEIFHEYIMSFAWGVDPNSNTINTNTENDPSKRQFAPLNLMRICSRWRNICISTPKLWVYHYIPLSRTRNPSNSIKPSDSSRARDPFKPYINLTQYTKFALFNSKSCPLHVHIHISISLSNPIAAAADLLFHASDRWQSAYLCIGLTSSSVVINPSPESHASKLFLKNYMFAKYPNLEELTLEYDLTGLSGLSEEQNDRGHGYCLPSFALAPRLHTLRVVKMRWWPMLDTQSVALSAVSADHADGEGGIREDREGDDTARTENTQRNHQHLPYSQIRTLTGIASLPTLYTLLQRCKNLEKVEVEQERFPGLALPPPDSLGSRLRLSGGEFVGGSHHYGHAYDWNSSFHASTIANYTLPRTHVLDAPHLHTLNISLGTNQPPLSNWLRHTPVLRTLSLTGAKLTSKVVHGQVVDDLIGFLSRQLSFCDCKYSRANGIERFALSTVEIEPTQLLKLFEMMPGLRELNLGRHAWGSSSYLGELRGGRGEVLKRLRVQASASASSTAVSVSCAGDVLEGEEFTQIKARVLLPRLSGFSLYFPRPPERAEFEELLVVLESRRLRGGRSLMSETSIGIENARLSESRMVEEGDTEYLKTIKIDVDIPGGLAGMLEQSEWSVYKERVRKVVGMP